ncbi:LuxR C-terminal-related transcriptional regulator [Microbulbifer harenosus]|uniref:Helix-turn-helix transcriptional regulator n=1 Tax=Microbulbifer harenosus TaxID=2576840 RepID=A0ABY2UQ36_9GAMM|nr:LuxR C-terminal-related transcriptional regulator [Microbulbifer harenosus]TLM79129.1 helix-turn-helix transcriptional regulator [Microbulbifer harenosus]
MADETQTGKPRTELLTGVWESRHEMLAQNRTALSGFRIDELMGRIFSNGPCYHYVFDLFDLSFLYISPQLEQHHDLRLNRLTFQDILEQIHPDDMAFVASAEATALRLVREQIGLEKITDYKFSYCFRFRVRDGSYRLFNHQSIVLTTDDEGRIGKSLNVHTDISHLCAENNYRLSMIGMNGEPSYLNIEVDGEPDTLQPSQPVFSQREISVIRLISRGFTSPEIARELALSEFTIKNHRKRILKKAGCQNMGQLFGSCIVEGLI